MKAIDNPYLKELVDELPGTVLQAKADSTMKCYSLSWQRWNPQVEEVVYGKTGEM